MRSPQQQLLEYVQSQGYDVAYWDGSQLEIYILRQRLLAPPDLPQTQLVQIFRGSRTSLKETKRSFLLKCKFPIVVCTSPEAREAWKWLKVICDPAL